MSDELALTVNGVRVMVFPGSSVAAAVAIAGGFCRTSISGEPRSVLCGMGICFECRVTIDGKMHCRSCQIQCEAGMSVITHD